MGPTVSEEVLVRLLAEARAAGAQAVHLAPAGGEYQVRFRLDGALVRQPGLTLSEAGRVLLALVLGLGPDPDDPGKRARAGQLAVRLAAGQDPWLLEVMLLETEAGEAAVLRPPTLRRGLAALGIDPADVARLRSVLRAGGLVLVSGQAHSGRRTFLTACLVELAEEARAVYSIGLPEVPGVVALRLEAPDAYLLQGLLHRTLGAGDTDALAMDVFPKYHDDLVALLEAAGTRRSVVVSQGAASNALAVLRLLDHGCRPWQVAGALGAAVSLRLLGRLCPRCRVPQPPPPRHELVRLVPRLVEQDLLTGWTESYRPGAGCSACRGGTAGQLPLAEVYLPEPTELDRLDTVSRHELEERTAARTLTLRERGFLRAAAGEVSLAEVLVRTPPAPGQARPAESASFG